jgi:hypothetical protein
MQDADLFLELAAIAGVFVGFGALIAVRSGGAFEPQEVSATRAVVMSGLMAVWAALGPVTLGRYDLTEHQVWSLSSALVLVSFVAAVIVQTRSPEYRAMVETVRPRVGVAGIVGTAAWVLMFGGATLAMVSVMLGLLPDQEAALYFTVVVVVLLNAAWALLTLVYAQRGAAAT